MNFNINDVILDTGNSITYVSSNTNIQTIITNIKHNTEVIGSIYKFPIIFRGNTYNFMFILYFTLYYIIILFFLKLTIIYLIIIQFYVQNMTD